MRVLLVSEKTVNCLLLRSRRHGQQGDVTQLERWIDTPAIELGTGLQRTRCRNAYGLPRIDGAGDAIGAASEADRRENEDGKRSKSGAKPSHVNSVKQRWFVKTLKFYGSFWLGLC